MKLKYYLTCQTPWFFSLLLGAIMSGLCAFIIAEVRLNLNYGVWKLPYGRPQFEVEVQAMLIKTTCWGAINGAVYSVVTERIRMIDSSLSSLLRRNLRWLFKTFILATMLSVIGGSIRVFQIYQEAGIGVRNLAELNEVSLLGCDEVFDIIYPYVSLSITLSLLVRIVGDSFTTTKSL